VVALLGEAGRLAETADVAIKVPSQDTQLIQQVHLAVEHLICELVERALFE
jgi:D-sedoheptulose 7-phosphate isomerase